MYVSTAPRAHAEPSIVFVDDAGARVLERVPLAAIGARPDGAAATARTHLALRGIVYALWNGRRLGFRRIAVHIDDPAAVAQLQGRRHVDPEAVGLYLEARALMHIYRGVHLDVGELVLSVLEPVDRPALPEFAISALS